MNSLETETDNSSKRFDSILQERLGFGKYHIFSYIIFGFILFCDGSEILSLSILVPIVRAEWNISVEQ